MRLTNLRLDGDRGAVRAAWSARQRTARQQQKKYRAPQPPGRCALRRQEDTVHPAACRRRACLRPAPPHGFSVRAKTLYRIVCRESPLRVDIGSGIALLGSACPPQLQSFCVRVSRGYLLGSYSDSPFNIFYAAFTAEAEAWLCGGHLIQRESPAAEEL